MATTGDDGANNARPTSPDLIDLHTFQPIVIGTTEENKTGNFIVASSEFVGKSDVDEGPSTAATGEEGADALHLLQDVVRRCRSSSAAMATITITRDDRASSFNTTTSGLSLATTTYRPRYIHLPFTDYVLYFKFAELFQKQDEELTDDTKQMQATMLRRMSKEQKKLFPILLRDYHNYRLMSFVDKEYRTENQ